jgi:hypothetical protein
MEPVNMLAIEEFVSIQMISPASGDTPLLNLKFPKVSSDRLRAIQPWG